MTEMTENIIPGYAVLIAAAVGLLFLGAALAAIYYRNREKKLLVNLSGMLDEAHSRVF